MANKIKWVDKHIELETMPAKFKKLTATRFATVMNLNSWNTPFQAWCEITKTYESPFEESKYTLGGKIIEGKVIAYLQNRYFMDIKTPTDVYGSDYFKKTWGDFFPDHKVLGGMWDALGDTFIVEIKTTQRSEDWTDTDAPIYYKLQAALYAYLKGFDDFVMTVTFLEEKDYPVQKSDGTWDTTATEAFKPNINNTKRYTFKVSEEFPAFKEDYLDVAVKFWNEHVLTGISPDYDEKLDAEALKALRKNTVAPAEDEIQALIKRSEELTDKLEQCAAKIKPYEDEKKEIDEKIKLYMKDQFREGDKKVEIAGAAYTYTLSMTAGRASIDSAALKKDGLYEKYSKTGAPSYSLKITANKEEK